MSGQYFDMFRANGPLPGEPTNASHVIRHDPSIKGDMPVIIPDSTLDSIQWVKTMRSQGSNEPIQLGEQSNRGIPDFFGPNLHTRLVRGGYPYLAPWWKRAIGLDWGYSHNAAVYWGCRNPETHQVHVYRELVLNRCGTEELGARIAEMSYMDLQGYPDNAITLYVSPDMWAKRGNVSGIQSFVELLTLGIRKILGDESVFVPNLDRDMLKEFEATGQLDQFEPVYLDFLRRVSQHKRSGLTVLRANNDRILGWDWMRTMMNWEHPVTQSSQFDPAAYARIAFEFNMEKALEYARMFEGENHVRPLIRIWDTCPRAITSIPRAIHSETNPEDVDKTHFQDQQDGSSMDCIDALRYLLVCFKDVDGDVPYEEKVRLKMNEYEKRNPNLSFSDRLWIHRALELKRGEMDKKREGIRFGRAGLSSGSAGDLKRYLN